VKNQILPRKAPSSPASAPPPNSTLPSPRRPAYLNWHVTQAGLDRDIFAPAAIDLLAEASEAIPRTLNLLAQSAWFFAARSAAASIDPDHVIQI